MADKEGFVSLETPVFRVSFPSVFEASSMDNGPPKFGVGAIWQPDRFTPREKGLWEAIMSGLDAEALRKFKVKWAALPANVKRGIRDGAEKADLEGYGPGTLFANLTSKMKPGLVGIEKGADGKPLPIGPEHGNADAFYPGCYARAKVTIYSYDNKGKGVGLGLNSLQKVANGARLDSRTSAADDFADSDPDSEWLDKDDGGF